jgi:nicotinamidase-related amidase
MVTALDKNTALVLIDLQNGIVQTAKEKGSAKVVENAAKLVSAFRKAGLPIVAVNVNPAGAKWVNARRDGASPARTPMSAELLEIAPELGAQPGDIFITKHTWSAFYETPLHDELQQRGVTGIVIAGISTSIGVEGTARAASERGYNITFAKDAMTDMFPEAHENSIKYIFPRMGEVDDTDRIVEKL